MKKEYIKKNQQGGKMSADQYRQKIGLPVMPRSSTAFSGKEIPKLGSQILKNYLTGKPVTPADRKNEMPGTPTLAKPTYQGEIKKPVNRSVRESMLKGLDKVDRNGDNLVAGLATFPLKSALNLLRPDKYFDGVQRDDQVGGALLHMAGDVGNVAMIGEGLGRLAKYVPSGSPALQAERAQHIMNTQGYDAAMEHYVDPRSLGEMAIDKVSQSALYKGVPARMKLDANGSAIPSDIPGQAYALTKPIPGVSELLNKTKLAQVRKNYIADKHIMKAPMTAENLEAFAQSSKGYMQGDGMIANKYYAGTGGFKNLSNSKFGDGQLRNSLKERFAAPKPGISDFDIDRSFMSPSEYTLHNDVSDGSPAMFKASLNIPERKITDYSFFAGGQQVPNSQQLKQAGNFMKNFQEKSPDFYTYDPGSLSGDSFTTLAATSRRGKGRYIPAKLDAPYGFGTISEFNGHGVSSGLSQALKTDRAAAFDKARKLNEQNLANLGVPEDVKTKLMNLYDLNGDATYIKTPAMKVPEGWTPQEPLNYNRVNQMVDAKSELLTQARARFEAEAARRAATRIDDVRMDINGEPIPFPRQLMERFNRGRTLEEVRNEQNARLSPRTSFAEQQAIRENLAGEFDPIGDHYDDAADAGWFDDVDTSQDPHYNSVAHGYHDIQEVTNNPQLTEMYRRAYTAAHPNNPSNDPADWIAWARENNEPNMYDYPDELPF